MAGSPFSALALSSSLAVLLRILAAKVSKSSLLTVGRPCFELSSPLQAISLVVWRLGGVQWGLPLDSQDKRGLLGRGRSRASCHLNTRALSSGSFSTIFFLAALAILAAAASLALCLTSALASGLSDFLGVSSLAMQGVSSTAILVCCATTASDSFVGLGSLLERLDSLLGELDSLGEVLVAGGLSKGFTPPPSD